MEEQISVVLADDHPPFRAGLRALLASAPDIEILGEAGTGTETIRLADKLQPDVILMDLQMPEMSGIEATRRIPAHQPAHRRTGPHHVRG